MRRITLLFIIIGNFILAQSIDRTYYVGNQSITLDLVTNELSVAFNTAQTALNDRQILDPVLNGLISSTKKMYGTKLRRILLNQNITEAQIQFLISRINDLSDVKMATPVLRWNHVRQAISSKFIVRYAPGTSQSQMDALNQQKGAQIIRKTAEDTYLLEVNKSSGLNGLTAANTYVGESIVVWAQPDFTYLDNDLLNTTVNDPLHPSQWAHVNTGQTDATGTTPSSVVGTPDADMDVDQAWDLVGGGDHNVIVAVIDAGVDTSHADLKANILYYFAADFSGDNDGPDAPGNEAHGTNCAGIIAAVGDNGVGVAGIAYNVQIMPVQIFNSAGSAGSADIGGAIDFAWQNGADVLSNSWGGGSADQAINDAIHRAVTQGRGGKGSVVLFSSGNDSNGNVNYPAYLTDVVAVGASNMFDEKKNAGSNDLQRWWGGNYGADLDVVAPTIVYTTDISGSRGYNTSSGSAGDYNDSFNGTSAACPNAAGVAALITSADLTLTGSQIRNILQNTADKVDLYSFDATGWNRHVGFGRVNAYQAVLAAKGGDGETPLIQHAVEQSSNVTTDRTISATITDNSGISGQPTLYYRRIGGVGAVDTSGWTAVTDLNGPSGNVYDFIVPGQSLGIQIEYYLSATDNSVNNLTVTFPFGGSGSTPPIRLLKYWVANLSSITYYNNTGTSWGFLSAGYFSSTMNVPDDFIIIDANATIDVNGTLSAYTIDLESPDNQGAGIATNNTGNNYTNTTLDDEATVDLTSGSSPYTGSFRPDNNLQVFDGKHSNGTWTLRCYVNNYLNAGAINSWNLQISYTTNDASLPVKLTSFTVQAELNGALLKWKTESEIENQGFTIMRSAEKDGVYTEIASYKTDESLSGHGTVSYSNGYSYQDHTVEEGNTYWYKLIDTDFSGRQIEHAAVRVSITKKDEIRLSSAGIPANFALKNNYPNPFNPTTHFEVDIPQTEIALKASIAIYNVLGKRVRQLFTGILNPGRYSILWDGRNDMGASLPTGMYIYSFTSPLFSRSRRMILIK